MTPETYQQAKDIMWKVGKLNKLKESFLKTAEDHYADLTWGELRAFFPELGKYIEEEIKILETDMSVL